MRKIIGSAVLLFVLSVTAVTVYQVSQRQKYQGEAAGQQECGRCSTLEGKENCWVTWIDRDGGGCDSDFYNERDEKCPDSRCSRQATPTPFPPVRLSFCITSERIYICSSTDQTYTSIAACEADLQADWPGRTTGKCYSGADCGGKCFPPAQDGKYHCSGCSTIYDKTFARWASTTTDCESDIVEGSQEYTPSCKCSTPGKPLYPGSAADMCDPSKNTLYVCSGCDMYKSTQRMFVTWLSRYADCSDVIIDPSRGIEPVYTQDLSCAAFAGQRATPTPTPMPEEDFCTLSAVNNPCYFGNIFGSTSNDSCGIKIRWSSNRDIQICFQPVGGQAWCGRTYGPGTHTGGVGVSMTYPKLIVIGKINGVTMCEIEVYGVKSSGEVTIPTLPPSDCQYESDGKTPICPLENIPGSQFTGPVRCEPGETRCGTWFDACGCPGRFWCVEGRHADCNEADDDRKTSESLGGLAKAKGDVNNDSKVDIIDIGVIINNYGSTNAVADVNGDGMVDIVDIGILIDNYGK